MNDTSIYEYIGLGNSIKMLF